LWIFVEPAGHGTAEASSPDNQNAMNVYASSGAPAYELTFCRAPAGESDHAEHSGAKDDQARNLFFAGGKNE